MRRLAQFVRLFASRVCLRLSASVCVCLFASVLRLLMLRVPNARVCVCVRLFTSRVPNACVCLLASASASVCVCVRQGFQMRAPVRQGVPNACVCVCLRLSASMCVCVYVRLRLRLLASMCVGRRSSCLASVVLSRVCLRLLAGTGSFYASVVIQRVQKVGGGFCYRHTIYPLAVHIDYVDYMNRPLIF